MENQVIEEITIGKNDYKLFIKEDGTYSIKRFNDQHKMWVVVNFIGTYEEGELIKKAVTSNLSNHLINTIAS